MKDDRGMRFRLAASLPLVGLLACAMSVMVPAAHADELDFGVMATATGSISYAGGAAPLVLSGVSMNAGVTDLGTGASAVLTGSCGGFACLQITTGNLYASDSMDWFFAGNSAPGSITIVGGASAAGIPAGASLLSGTVSGARVINVGAGVDVTTTVNSVDPGLLTFFGIPTSPDLWNGSLNLSFLFSSSVMPPAAFSGPVIASGDLIDMPAPDPTPEPGSIALLLIGLAALALIVRNRNEFRGSTHRLT